MDIAAFVNWSKEKGVETTASVEETSYAGYGLFATETMENDSPTVVAHIPNDVLLTSTKVLQIDSAFAREIYTLLSRKYNTTQDLESLAQDSKNERLVLCLFLIYCKFFKPSTSWKPYIDILPTVKFFKDNHILFNTEYVTGTSLEMSIRAKLSSLKRELDEINDIERGEEEELQDQGKEDNDSSNTWLSNIQFEMYIWADCVFWSRVVGIGGDQDSKSSESPSTDMSLIPFFDFANHSNDKSNIRWQLIQGGIDLVTYPGEMIEKGNELLLSYGSKPNQELLFLHGFCIEDNPQHSRVTIPLLPFLNPAESPNNLLKIQWLKQISVKPSLTLTDEDNHEDENELVRCGWTFDSIAVMYVVAMDEDNHLVLDEEEDHTVLCLSGREKKSLDDIASYVKELHHLPLIKLKVAVLLLEALEYHYSMIDENDTHREETFLWKQAKIYRLEERNTIKSAIDNLTKIRDNLLTDPTVVEFLEHNNFE